MIKIVRAVSALEREPLLHPFAFKGGSLSELWQSIVRVESDSGKAGTGLGTQSVLWSGPRVFSAHSENEGNALMRAVTKRALQMIEGVTFEDPISLLEDIFGELYLYGQQLTGRPDLYKTFILNALVAADNALWLLYARERSLRDFDEMIPSRYRPAFSYRHQKISCIPLISYGTTPEEITRLAEEGCLFIKIKIGHPGTQQEMLEKDKNLITRVHRALSPLAAADSGNDRILYYIDANGRYQSKETLLRFLDHLRKTGALERVAILEEPFPQEDETDVSGLEVRIAADESAHTDFEALARIQMGYRAIALKAVAKTLSMTLKIANTAHEHGIPCFCADLTANPLLLEWNKNVAARLAPFPGIQAGLLETNGKQHYRNWDKLCSYHPRGTASWARPRQGMFGLNEEYYRSSGGIFEPSPHYESFFNPANSSTREPRGSGVKK